jgi:hypothetical protein
MHNLIKQSDTNEESESHSPSDGEVQLPLFDQQDLTNITGRRDNSNAGLKDAQTCEEHRAQSIELSGTESISGSQPTTQFQLSLSADELARLWLREPNLNPSNVYAWSGKRGQWVPALSVPEVADQIVRARIEGVKKWSVLCASRISATIAPPPQLSRQLSGGIPTENQLSSRRGSRLLPQSFNIVHHRTEELEPQIKTFAHWRYSRSERLRSSIRKQVVGAGFQIDFYRTRARRYLRRHVFRMASWTGVSIAAVVVVAWLSHNGRRMQTILEHSIAGKPGRTQNTQNVANSLPTFIVAQPSAPKVDDVMTTIDPPLNSRTLPTLADLPKKPTAASVMQHFDAGTAERAIEKSTARAQDCTDGDIYGKLVVTFFSSSYVQNVDFIQFSGDGIQRNCVADLVGKLRITPFSGGPVMVRKNIHVRGAGS